MGVVCTFLLVMGADPVPKESGTPRKPNPLAPSLPELTEKEEAELDRIIGRFILADTGKLDGAEGKSAMDQFKEIGPEGTFALIRGFNKSAHIEHSCPALTISRKLKSILRSSNDVNLLMYAKENIGAGVKMTRYGDVIREVKSGCSQRITQLKSMPNSALRNRP